MQYMPQIIFSKKNKQITIKDKLKHTVSIRLQTNVKISDLYHDDHYSKVSMNWKYTKASIKTWCIDGGLAILTPRIRNNAWIENTHELQPRHGQVIVLTYLDLNLVKSFPIIDTNDTSNHFRHDDHVSQMCPNWLWLLTRRCLFLLLQKQEIK